MTLPRQQVPVKQTGGSISIILQQMRHILKRFALTVTALLTAAPPSPAANAMAMAWTTLFWEQVQPDARPSDKKVINSLLVR
jgi:hypothetical protein